MLLEDRKKLQMYKESLITIEADLIKAKYRKIQEDKSYERCKKELEESIKSTFYGIAKLKRQSILREKGLAWSADDDTFCEMESKEEFDKWRNMR